MTNGDGIRAVLFVSGCTHGCKGCQNPITWDKDSGLKFDEGAKEELFNELRKDYVSGVTISGGDPLAIYNRNDVMELIRELKDRFPDKTIWVYTGYEYDDLLNETPLFANDLLNSIDVLVDGPYIEELRSVDNPWAGSLNQTIRRAVNDWKPDNEPVYEYDRLLNGSAIDSKSCCGDLTDYIEDVYELEDIEY